MAGRTGNVKVSITADDSGLQRGLRGAEGDLNRFGKRGADRMHGLKVAALGAGAAITTGLVIGLKKSVDAAIEAEKSQTKMQAQLKALGISYKAHAKQIDAVIQKTSKLAGLDDEDLQDAFTKIVRSTGSVNTGLKDMAVVADLARAGHMEVGRAADIVSKAHAGSFVALKKYIGAVVPVTKAQDALKASTEHATTEQVNAAKAADKTATAQKALGVLQDRLKGQSEAYGKTAAGAQDRFRVAMENLKETIGARLLPVVTQIAEKVGGFVQQMLDGKGAGGEFADSLRSIYGRVKPIIEFFTQHPKFVAVAVTAWAAYKTASSAALAATKLKLIGQFAGLVGPASKAGARSGLAFGTAYSAASGERMANGLILQGGNAGKGFAAAAGAAIRGFGWAALGAYIIDATGLAKQITKTLDDIFPLNGSGSKIPTFFAAMTDGIKAGSAAADDQKKKFKLLELQSDSYGKSVKATGKESSTAAGGIKKAGDSARDAGGKAKRAAGETDGLKQSLGDVSRGKWKVDVDTSNALARIRELTTNAINLGIRLSAIANAGSGGGGGGGSAPPNAGKGGGRTPTAEPASVRRGPDPNRAARFNPANDRVRPGRAAEIVQNLLGIVDLQERAGIIGASGAINRRFAIATQNASGSIYGPIGYRDRLELLAVKREAAQAQKDRYKAKRSKTLHAGFTKYEKLRDLVNEREAAGELTPEQADQFRLALVEQAISHTGQFKGMGLSAHEKRLALADRQSVLQGRAGATADAASAAADTAAADTTAALEETNRLLQQQLDLMKQASDAHQRALNVSQSQYDVFRKWIAGVVSGEIGGQMGLGFQTPSFAGGMARY